MKSLQGQQDWIEIATKKIAKLQHMGIERGLEFRQHKIADIIRRALVDAIFDTEKMLQNSIINRCKECKRESIVYAVVCPICGGDMENV